MIKKQDKLLIDIKKKRIKGRFNVAIFEDGGHKVAYLQSLEATGYGQSDQEALDMLLKVVLEDLFHNLVLLPEHQIMEDLKKLGWKRNVLFKKRFEGAYVDNEGILQNLNLSPETKIKNKFITV